MTIVGIDTPGGRVVCVKIDNATDYFPARSYPAQVNSNKVNLKKIYSYTQLRSIHKSAKGCDKKLKSVATKNLMYLGVLTPIKPLGL